MVASENYQMESEIQIENISSGECLSDMLKTINYKNRKEILCKEDIGDSDILKNGSILHSKAMLSKGNSETVSEIIYQDAVNLEDTKLSNVKQNIRVNRTIGTQGSPVQPKIRRVPSTANPKHRTPLLHKSQRSSSSPHIQPQVRQNQRRQSLPQNLHNVASVHNKNNVTPSNNNSLYQELIRHQLQIQQNAKKTPVNSTQDIPAMSNQNGSVKGQQQQIIYIQIPNVPPTQNYDSQILQQQISMQLQQLVPQIYSQLVNQTTVQQTSDLLHSRSQSPSTLSLNSNSSGETISSSRGYQYQGTSAQDSSQPHRKRKKCIDPITASNQTIEVINETLQNIVSQNLTTDNTSSNTFAQDNTILLPQFSSIDIQQSRGIPEITIPLSQELLLQCQQLRDPVFAAYQPRLETIHEEAMSVKKLAVKKMSKSKILACILTVLSLIVVVILAGDRTIAVVVVTVMFLIFFLGLVGFLYLNSAKNSNERFTP